MSTASEKRGQARGMKKEILIAWQVRLFRNIQRRCTECVPPSPTSSPPAPAAWWEHPSHAWSVPYPVSRRPSTLPRPPPRLVRENKPYSVDLYESLKKKNTLSGLTTAKVHKIALSGNYESFRVLHLLLRLSIFQNLVLLLLP